MVRAARAQRNHIGTAIRAFVRLEWHRVRTGIGGKLAKEGIIRRAVLFLSHPPRNCVRPTGKRPDEYEYTRTIACLCSQKAI